ncbi:MAG: hypothetical protein WBM57_15775 [Woeseiaceae bacterium]
MNTIAVLASLAVAVQLSGCTINKEKYTSGLIGCPENEIQILESSGGLMANTWTAKCGDKVFYCTYRSGSRVDCKESILSNDE